MNQFGQHGSVTDDADPGAEIASLIGRCIRSDYTHRRRVGLTVILSILSATLWVLGNRQPGFIVPSLLLAPTGFCFLNELLGRPIYRRKIGCISRLLRLIPQARLDELGSLIEVLEIVPLSKYSDFEAALIDRLDNLSNDKLSDAQKSTLHAMRGKLKRLTEVPPVLSEDDIH